MDESTRQVAPSGLRLPPINALASSGRLLNRSVSRVLLATKKRVRDKPGPFTESAMNPALNQVCPLVDGVEAIRKRAPTRTVVEEVGEVHLRRLHALFHICDGDEDGVLSSNELMVLLQLLGASETDAAAVAASASALHPIGDDVNYATPPTIGASFESFLNGYQELIVACYERQCELPSRAFVARSRPLKRGFHNCDTDGSLVITRTELEIALQKLDVILGDDKIDCVMELLDRNADGTIEWSEFLFAAWKSSRADAAGATSALQQYFHVEIFSDVPSFIRVAPSGDGAASMRAWPESTTSARGIRRSSLGVPTSYVSRIEHVGIRLLTRAAEAGNGISSAERRAIFRLEAFATTVGAVTRVLFGLLAIGLDAAIFPKSLDTDTVSYYAYASLLNVAVSLVEVHVLYLTALVSAFRLTVGANLILSPLDREREFLTRAIARAALQAGNRKDALFGIDPMRDSPRLVATVTLLLYNTKRYALKFLLKLIIKCVLWRAAARTALSLLVLPVNALSNAWTLRRVMRHCRVDIIGPPCVVAVLEVFLLENDCFLPPQRVDYLRVIGCALVSKRAIRPNAEIMLQYLRHRWVCAEFWPSESEENAGQACSCLSNAEAPCEAHPLDNTDRLLSTLEVYGAILDADSPQAASTREAGPMAMRAAVSVQGGGSANSVTLSVRRGDAGSGSARQTAAGLPVRRHVRNIFFLLVVSLIIDGSLGWAERTLFVRCCQAAGVRNHWSRVLRLKRAFVAGQGIDVDTVFALVERRGMPAKTQSGSDLEMGDSRGEDSARVPVSEALVYLWNRLAGLLSC